MKNTKHKINRQISCQQVRIIGDNSYVTTLFNALKEADSQDADLIQISESNGVAICTIMEYEKFLYKQKQKEKENKKKQVQQKVKELRFGPQTGDHDYQFKLKQAREFIVSGNKVRAYVFFKGRSIVYKEQGEVILLKMATDLEDIAKVEQMPKLDGKKMIITLSPKKTK